MKPIDLKLSRDSEKAEPQDFLALLKPGVMMLVVYTAFVAALVAPGQMHPYELILAIFSVALGSGAAGAINMWYDRDIDCVMKRTQNRPIPEGKIAPHDALSFGVILSIASIILMGLTTNWLASAILLGSILFYVFIYTVWLKRLTPQNIVIGGAAGAFPPMIGWAATTGEISLQSVVMFMVIFLWTPPHFWALALYRNEDYKTAEVPMLPVVSGVRATKKQIVLYSVFLVLSTLSPYFLGFQGIVYFVVASTLGAIFLYYAVRLAMSSEGKYAMRLFGFSILYLFLLFSSMLVDCWIG